MVLSLVVKNDPASAFRAVNTLSKRVEQKDWELVLDSFARCVRITRDLDEVYPVDSKSFEAKAEIKLGAEMDQALSKEISPGDLEGFLEVFEPMVPAITDFFDNVLVMDEDDLVRKNRLGLLQSVVSLADGILDFSRLEGF